MDMVAVITVLAIIGNTIGFNMDTTKVNRQEVFCLAENVYHEARGEHMIGQIMVANVTMNRVKSGRFPDTVCDVVHQPWQFSWTHQRVRFAPKKAKEWEQAVDVAAMVYLGIIGDLTNGVMFYYNPKQANPYWARKMEVAFTEGNHIFMAH